MMRTIIVYLFYFCCFSIFLISCAKNESSSGSSSSSDITSTSDNTTTASDKTTSSFAVSEITQTNQGDGYLSGSFVVPSDGISFMLGTFMDNNGVVAFYSLTDPDGTNILSSSSVLYNKASGSGGDYGFANVLVPQTSSFSAKAGTWTFKNYNNDRVKIGLRTGSAPTSTTFTVQPYITGTTWSASDISATLTVMSNIYSTNGITLTIKDTITISESQYAAVSYSFTNSTTSALISQGSTDTVNLFFVEDQPSGETALYGVSGGLPGPMGIASSWNGVLNFLTAHATGTTLNTQLLAETAAHEMGHWLGLFHTTESGGISFDILSDTAECPISRDNDSNGKVLPEECDGYGADNVMFWTAWSPSSQAAGKKQDTLSTEQKYVLKYSPLAK
jgi:predicted Zn-dependent protease